MDGDTGMRRCGVASQYELLLGRLYGRGALSLLHDLLHPPFWARHDAADICIRQFLSHQFNEYEHLAERPRRLRICGVGRDVRCVFLRASPQSGSRNRLECRAGTRSRGPRPDYLRQYDDAGNRRPAGRHDLFVV